ncbi:MAG: tRNA pseudouridine(38-40) synthase TruA [Phaeospirillum sp.]|nr:tRNA pseudouridine(38-40) synthase TruA [Phaeospirillum sp.]
MPRYRLLVEYNGTPFVGWQRQDNGASVQGVLEAAVIKLCGHRIAIYAAGRTDAGVHATGQVAHVDLPKDYPAETVRAALNYHMSPHPVAVVEAEEVGDDFHARFSAIGRSYLYRILNRRAPPALDLHRVLWLPMDLDVAAMNEAAQRLIGHHDFSTFRARDCQAQSPMKTLDRLTATRVGEEIHVVAEARSFLHHQVRNMVGTLQLVGRGNWSADRMAEALEARDRRAGGPTAKPGGLYLTGVKY